LRLRWIGLALAVTLTLTLPLEAWSQVQTAAIARIKLLNKKAMDEYDGLEFEAAKTILLEAAQVAKDSSVTKGPTLVLTYLNLGMVYGAGLNDRINAIKYFTEAIRLDPKAELSATRATPTLEEMFKTAKENVGTAVVRPPAGGLRHTPVDEGSEGKALRPRARVGADLGAKRVVLFFRSGGAAEFVQVVMQEEQSETYVGVIPGDKVTGRSLQYYIEAQDDDGKKLASAGTAASPNVVVIKQDGTGPKPPTTKRKVFSLGVLVGFGVGVVYGGRSEHTQPQVPVATAIPEAVDIKPGGAVAPFHVMPELSYHITDQWHISALVRIQMVNATTERGAISALGEVRAKRFFGGGDLRFYLAFGAGGGQIRHRIPLGDYDNNEETPNDISDTRVAGVGAFGLGGGLQWMFSSYVGLVAELNALILVPDFAAHADLNTGLVFSF
jgi:hypothetical protein